MALLMCPECGGKVSSYADACPVCGCPKNIFEKIVAEKERQEAINDSVLSIKPMSLVKASCTSCNATLEVDSKLQTAKCPYCSAIYVVSQAVNNYNMNITNANVSITGATINMADNRDKEISNHILRAQEFKKTGQFELAIQYYEKVLDIDANNQSAISGKQQMLGLLNNPFYTTEVKYDIISSGKIALYYKVLSFSERNKILYTVRINEIENLSYSKHKIRFNRPRVASTNGGFYTYKVPNGEEFYNVLLAAISGRYMEIQEIIESSNK